jgi:hypothetical protein
MELTRGFNRSAQFAQSSRRNPLLAQHRSEFNGKIQRWPGALAHPSNLHRKLDRTAQIAVFDRV